jgi:hypothetical protein
MDKEEQIKKLFEEQSILEEQVKFGCVLFDLQEVAGKMIPAPGSGWASIEGKSAFRIKSLVELSNQVKWLTNLSQEVLWKANLAKQTKLKHSGYLRTDINQISKELGLIIPVTPVTKVCETLSELFNKIMKLAIEFYGLSTFTQKELHLELKSALLTNDKNISTHLDEALSRAYQDLVICDHVLQKEKQIFVSLKRPRYFHAKTILETPIPIVNGDWKFYAADEMPGTTEQKIEFLMSLDKPFITKISINNFENTDNLYVDLSKLLNLGEALGDGGKTKERNWVCQPELLYLSRFSNLDIQAAFVAEGYQEMENNIILPYLGELSDFSLSLGILSECVWTGIAGRSTNPQTRGKSLVSPRACWLKAADRFMTFTSAMMLSSAGFTVTSYGYGAVNIAIDEDKISHLIEIAPHAGLSIPLNIIDKKTMML